MAHLHPLGFYTQEIREGGVRQGFTLNGLDGSSGVLAHVDFARDFRVGRYGVDIIGFEDFINRLSFFDKKAVLVMIDEIGKMECFSEKFVSLITDVLDSGIFLIATVALKGAGPVSVIKERPDTQVLQLTHKNREALLSQILKLANSFE